MFAPHLVVILLSVPVQHILGTQNSQGLKGIFATRKCVFSCCQPVLLYDTRKIYIKVTEILCMGMQYSLDNRTVCSHIACLTTLNTVLYKSYLGKTHQLARMFLEDVSTMPIQSHRGGYVLLNSPITHTTATRNILKAPELGTPRYKGQNFDSQWCLFESGSTVEKSKRLIFCHRGEKSPACKNVFSRMLVQSLVTRRWLYCSNLKCEHTQFTMVLPSWESGM